MKVFKVSATWISTLLVVSSSAFANANPATYQPFKITYDDLVNAHENFPSEDFHHALQHVGLVSVTGIPEDANKEEALSWLHSCALESEATVEHKFDDDTVRLTLTTHTIPGGAQPIDHMGSSSAACDSFSKMTDSLRDVTGKATNAFANRLALILKESKDEQEGSALLYAKDGTYGFDTFADVVENGEHLEHFHSYQKKSTSNMRNTIDMHVDQGLFIVFTPGAIVNKNNEIVRLSEGFYIEMEDGSQAMVEFDESDDLVFMLGDGINQIIKPRYGDSILRATPHALSLPTQTEEARVWYGRMVLPPSSAMHPEDGESFGDIRQEMIDASLSGNEQNGVGCTGNSMVARQLETESCAEGTFACWHRCMNVTEFNVSATICEEQNLDLVCANAERKLWDGIHDSSFFPSCLDNSTAEMFVRETEPPTEGTADTDTSAANGILSLMTVVVGSLLAVVIGM